MKVIKEMTEKELLELDKWLFDCMGALDHRKGDKFGINFWVIPNSRQEKTEKKVE